MASTPSDICPDAADPCLVNADFLVPGGTTLDFGARHLVIQQNKSLDVERFQMTIRAGRLTIEPGGALLGASGRIDVAVAGVVDVQRNRKDPGRIDASGNDAFPIGGQIDIVAGEDVNLQGDLLVRGKGEDELGGGVVAVQGRNVVVSGTIDGTGGRSEVSFGGDVTLTATSALTVSGSILTTGGEGGAVELEATGRLAMTGLIDAQAIGDGGSGGSVLIDGGPLVTLGGTMRLKGNDGESGGSGGELLVICDGTFSLTGDVDSSGGVPGGEGGAIGITAGDDIDLIGPMIVRVAGSSGIGGEVTLVAGHDIRIGSIDATGVGAGGAVAASAGCDLTVPQISLLDTRGAATSGEIDLQSGGTLTIAGRLFGGANVTLRSRPDHPVQLDPTSMISPTPSVLADEFIVPCGGPPPEGCGDKVVQGAEECDDGNTDACDGCLNCKKEECGNGTQDCGEFCDDGNEVGCDGCAADCSRESPLCGDGTTECDEQGDDHNTADCDGISSVCTVEACGNGRLDCPEECDDGASGSDTCGAPGTASACKRILATCGNHDTQPGEDCDDGNIADCDGCSHLCQFEMVGNGVTECAEECDDFNMEGCDGCSDTGRIERCGDGIMECAEECDAGAANGTLAAGCTTLCEEAPVCRLGGPSPCFPCTGPLDCDTGGACSGWRCNAGTCVQAAPPACEDGSACTVDACDPVAGCTHVPQSCEPDASACTVDACDHNRGCVHDPLDCDDGNACTVDGCNAASGCTTTPRTCDDGNACTDDACDPATGCTTTPRTCDDGNTCTVDACSPATGCTATPVSCDDGDECTDDDRCDPSTGCINAPRPGAAGARCQLDAIARAIGGAPADRLTAKLKKKLTKAVARAVRASDAVARARTEKKRAKQLRKLAGLIRALGALVDRSRGEGFDPTLAAQVKARVEGASEAANS